MPSNVWDKGNWIGIRDSLGREIQVGDTIMYDATVWGCSVSNRGVVEYDAEEACFGAIGTPSEWSEFTTIIKKWDE